MVACGRAAITTPHYGPWILVCLVAGACPACDSQVATSSACDGFADRTTGILGSEYRSCARAILSQLDTLEQRLRPLTSGDTTSLSDAQDPYRHARKLIRHTGIERDYRSRNAAGLQRWPEAVVRSFNEAAWGAVVQWGSAIGSGSVGNFVEGRRQYVDARRLYEYVR